MRFGAHPPESHRHGSRWSARDDARLRLSWGCCSLTELAAELGRSPLTTYYRGRVLGLQCGAPPHGEYLTAAAKRTGYTTCQLRPILRAAGVTIHQTVSRPSGKARTYHWVDPVEVDDAVATWLSTECLEPASVARGLASETLRRLLEDAGAKPYGLRRGARRKARKRYNTVEIDRVVAAYREKLSATASVSAHARRVGLDRVTLAKRLRAAGVLTAKQPGIEVRLPAEVVDRALRRAA